MTGSAPSPARAQQQPLARLSSIKIKLGAVVAVSVLVSTLLATWVAGVVPAWLSIPVVVALALAVTQLIAAGMVLPLAQMTHAAQRMARGDYAARVLVTGNDEVARLARSFNTMSADLAAVDQQRRDLVSTVSHEIRTPLAALTAQLENMADGVTPADPEHLEAALGQATRLGTLVQDLLDLSRVDGGAERLRLGSVNLPGLLDQVIAEIGAIRPAIRIGRRTDVALSVTADESRLRQVLANLIDNASRHASHQVEVRAGRTPSGWWLEVADDGPGVPVAARAKVFERFGTADPATGGTGLGLAVARSIVGLHGGRLDLLEAATSESNGATFRIAMPATPPQPARNPTAATGDKEITMPDNPASNTPVTNQPVTHQPVTHQPVPPSAGPADYGPADFGTTGPVVQTTGDYIFGTAWPERPLPAPTKLVTAGVMVGVLAGLIWPIETTGLGWSLVLLAAGGVILTASRHKHDSFTRISAGICALLALVPTVRDAGWVVVLSVLCGTALMTIGVCRGRNLGQFFLSGVALPLAGLRGLPLLGRTIRAMSGGSRGPAVARTVLLSLIGFGIFALLFSSADAVFGGWLDAVLPNVESGEWIGRIFIGIMIAGVTLAASYLSLNPPPMPESRPGAPVRNRYEWLVPVLIVDAVFVLFLLAQSRATLGGHDWIEQTTGLTYAEYVHSGFAQMNVATVLSLIVLWAGARHASRETFADRLWLRISLGLLGVCTLAVIASSVWRMTQYVDAYGLTRLRYLVYFFEGWLALVFLGVLVWGAVRLHAPSLARVAVLTGAGAVLALAVSNPDAVIAEHNLTSPGQVAVDTAYLSGLSDDATPVLIQQRPSWGPCLELPESGIWEWSLGKHRAAAALGEVAGQSSRSCGWAV